MSASKTEGAQRQISESRLRDVATNIRVRRGAFTLEVDRIFAGGKVTAVIGRNGSGKSTLAESIAGFIPQVEGVIRRGDELLTDTQSPSTVRVVPHLRRTVLLKQRAHLFTTMSVAHNIAFGPLAQGRSRADAAATAHVWMERLHLADFRDRKPNSLSGGQQQRVALARALAANPSTLLLDEPTSTLDVDAAALFRQVLAEQLHSWPITTVLVTHAVEDVVALADYVVVLEDGKVVESGEALEHLMRPRHSFTATFAGLNRVEGTWDGTALTSGAIALRGKGFEPIPGEGAYAAFDPGAVRLEKAVPPAPGAHSPSHERDNTWTTTVARVDASHTGFAVRLAQPRGAVAQLDLAAYNRRPILTGDQVQARVSKAAVSIYS